MEHLPQQVPGEGLKELRSGVQPVGSFGQGSYSVSEMSLCCIINGTVFCSIDAHLEFCGASLENDL